MENFMWNEFYSDYNGRFQIFESVIYFLEILFPYVANGPTSLGKFLSFIIMKKNFLPNLEIVTSTISE